MIPTPHSVVLKRRQLGPPDRYNNRHEEWVEAGTIPVHAISGPDAALSDPQRTGDRIDWVIYAPKDVTLWVAVRDKLVVNNTECRVVKVLDWTQGPWIFPSAGVEIHVTEVEG